MIGLVLLTGATGYVGGRLRRRLEEQGRPLRCLARRRAVLDSQVGATTEVVEGDALEPETLRAAFEGVETATTSSTRWAPVGTSKSKTGSRPATSGRRPVEPG